MGVRTDKVTDFRIRHCPRNIRSLHRAALSRGCGSHVRTAKCTKKTDSRDAWIYPQVGRIINPGNPDVDIKDESSLSMRAHPEIILTSTGRLCREFGLGLRRVWCS